MAEGKWIHGLRPDMELAEAARKVLAVRLKVVREYLPRAMHRASEDPENVHQLRVGTRRADAACRTFRDCLPGRVYRAARKRLRHIRQAAGVARDWDVFLLALRGRGREVSPPELPGVDFLIGYSLGQREAAQALLADVEAGQKQSFTEFMEVTLDALRPPHEDTDARLAGLAQEVLSRLLAKFAAAAAGDLKDYEHLHQVRIAAKRLRYAVEVLGGCFPAAMHDVVYPKIEEVQEILGRANDSHVAGQRLALLREEMKPWPQTWERAQVGVEALLRFHQRRLPQERRRFLKWWEQWRQVNPESVLSEPGGAA